MVVNHITESHNNTAKQVPLPFHFTDEGAEARTLTEVSNSNSSTLSPLIFF